MKKYFAIFFSLLLFSSWLPVRPDQSQEANAKIKTIYIYNFTKYIEWPASYKQGNFIVGVFGNSPALLSELTKMASMKTVGSQKFEVKAITNANDASLCHIVYILSENSGQISEVISKLKSKSALIVTDKSGMAERGSGINFVIVDNKQKIELNRSNIEKYKLKVASTLVEMAVQVK